MPVNSGHGKVGKSSLTGRTKWARAQYSFATDGGAVGDITLTTTPTIPSGALVLRSFAKVGTAFTSGGAATVAVKLEGAADLNAADAISGAPWSTTGLKQLDGTGGDNEGVVTTAALTAGVADIYVEYIEPA